jgi:hypothetical protein
MKRTEYHRLIEETNSLMEKMREEFSIVREGEGIDNLFNQLKDVLQKITMLPNNVINANKYQEHEIVDGLKEIGYSYKKPIGTKLHFFDKKTSISVYLDQRTKHITLQP